MRHGRTIAIGGMAAGLLDLTWALVSSGVLGGDPSRLLQSIASGLLGKVAYEGGLATASLGVVLHFVIAFGACAVAGPLYGVVVYLCMYLVVVPLSAAPFELSFAPQAAALALAAHVLCVGLPIALSVSRSAAGKPAAGA